jgi:hypothetical protein
MDELGTADDVVAGDVDRTRRLARYLEQPPAVVAADPRRPAPTRQFTEDALAPEC